jgi:Family of unknown function (DUF6338)
VPPSTWLAVVLFVLAVAPGLLFDVLAERRRAGLSESGFREASRVVLASLVFSSIATGILLLVRSIKSGWMPDPRQLLLAGRPYLAARYGLILRALVIEVGIALVLAWAAHVVLARRQGGASIRQVSAWSQVFRRDMPPGHDVYVRVRLTSGSVYSGRVVNFTAGLDTEGRELVLAPPLSAKPATGPNAPLPPLYQRVVVRGEAIDVISVDYRPRDRANPDGRTALALLAGQWWPRLRKLTSTDYPSKAAPAPDATEATTHDGPEASATST